jgi:putative peptidoglycan lipid II flippase
MWNLAMIVFLAINYGVAPDGRFVNRLMWVAVVGAALQLAVQLPTLFKVEKHLSAHWAGARNAARTVVRAALPIIFGRGGVQISGYIDYFLVSYLAAGTLSVMRYAQMLYMLPISLLGFSVAAAELPELSRMRDLGAAEMIKRTRAALRVTWFWTIPVLVAFLALGEGIVGVLFQGGSFEASDTRIVYAALATYTLGLLPANGARVMVNSLYAIGNTKTPARISIIRIAVSAVVGAALMFLLLRTYNGVVAVLGMCFGSAVGSWVEFLLMRRALNRELEGGVLHGLALGRIALLCITVAAVVRAIVFVLPERYQQLGAFTAPFVFGAGVLLIGMAMKLPEFSRLLNVFKRGKR